MSKVATRPKQDAPSKSGLSGPSSPAGKGAKKGGGGSGGPRRLKVGVTLFLREGGQTLWENGIFQNCYFLLMLLERSPLVEKCFIINGGPGIRRRRVISSRSLLRQSSRSTKRWIRSIWRSS